MPRQVSTTSMDRASLLKRLHGELRANYASKWDADTDSLYQRVLSEMYDEVGAERLSRAVRRCLNESAYLSVAALRGFVPEAATPTWKPTEQEKQEAEAARKSPEAQEFFNLLRKMGVKGVNL